MSDYNFEYKCRRCGTILLCAVDTSADNIYQFRSLLYDIVTEQVKDDPMLPSLVSLHNCEDGGIGIVDLIGCKEVKL